MTAGRVMAVVAACCTVVAVANAQNRKLGPKDRDVILDARVDASFASTPLSSLALLPFSNELDYSEGADVLSQHFIAAMAQKHPDIKIKSAEETRQLIKQLNLSNEYRSFSGNYTNTGVFTTPFLQALGRPAKIDAVLLGRVLAYGAQRETRAVVTGIGTLTWNRDRAVAGMELTLVRAADGRELWRGVHAVEGAKNENVIEVSRTVGSVFAAFFGRRPY